MPTPDTNGHAKTTTDSTTTSESAPAANEHATQRTAPEHLGPRSPAGKSQGLTTRHATRGEPSSGRSALRAGLGTSALRGDSGTSALRADLPLHGASDPGSTDNATTPGSFARKADIGGPLMFASPDTPGMPPPSDKTAWDFLPDGWTCEIIERSTGSESTSFEHGRGCVNVKDARGTVMCIGRASKTKVNANMGASPVSSSDRRGGREAAWAERWGADTVMDLRPGAISTPARGDHRASDGADRDGADLLDDHRSEARGPGRETILRHGRAPGEAGRGLLHDPRGRAQGAPASSSRSGSSASSRAAGRCWRSGCSSTAARTRCTRCGTRSATSCGSTTCRSPSATGCGPAGWPTRRTRRSSRAGDDRRADRAGVASRRAGDGRGARARAVRSDRVQHEAPAALCATARRSTCSGPLVTDVFPGYDHITSASARRTRRTTARRCCATSRPRSTWACRRRAT